MAAPDKETLDYYLKRMQGKDLEMAYELGNSVSNHLDSFNLIYEGGLSKIAQYLQPLEMTNGTGRRVLPF